MFFLPLTAPPKSFTCLLTVWSYIAGIRFVCRDCIRNLWIYCCITITSVIGANRSWWTQLRGVLNVKCCMTSTTGRVYDLCVSCMRTLQYSKLQSLLSNPRLINYYASMREYGQFSYGFVALQSTGFAEICIEIYAWQFQTEDITNLDTNVFKYLNY